MSIRTVTGVVLSVLVGTLALGGLARSQPGGVMVAPGGPVVSQADLKPLIQRVQELEKTTKQLEGKVVALERQLAALGSLRTHTHRVGVPSLGKMSFGTVYGAMKNNTGGNLMIAIHQSSPSGGVETSKPE